MKDYNKNNSKSHLDLHKEIMILRAALERIATNWPWLNLISAADIAQKALEDVEEI